jgi:hypothetical protein
MAEKKLGLLASEVTLPPTLTIELPVDLQKQIDKQTVSDGSFRWNFKKTHRAWSLNWVKLTKAQLDVLTTLQAYNKILKWQNNDESVVWYNVVITEFSYDSVDPISTTKIYKASMTLEEAI